MKGKEDDDGGGLHLPILKAMKAHQSNRMLCIKCHLFCHREKEVDVEIIKEMVMFHLVRMNYNWSVSNGSSTCFIRKTNKHLSVSCAVFLFHPEVDISGIK